jgi:hypothetical protein
MIIELKIEKLDCENEPLDVNTCAVIVNLHPAAGHQGKKEDDVGWHCCNSPVPPGTICL